MKKFSFLCSTAFLILFSYTVQGQSPSDSSSYTRELGFGTNIVLSNVFNSGGAPFDFMYRWKSGNGYMRLGTSIFYSREHSAHDNLKVEWMVRTINPHISLGKEWREEISERWLFNYGADINMFYRSSRNENKSENWDQVGDYTVGITKKDEFGAGIRPFVGIMFKINQKLILGTEASFLTNVYRSLQENESYVLSNGIKNEVDPNNNIKFNSWNFQVLTRPANNIFLFYRF